MEDPGAVEAPRQREAVHWRAELVAAGALLLWSVIAAVVVAARPGANAIDRWGFAHFPYAPDDTWYTRTVTLDKGWILAVAVGAAALVCVFRDRWRAAAVVLGPMATVFAVEFVLKPLVGRRLDGVLSYPSGNAAVIAAVATAWVLAVPRVLRIPVAVIAAGVVGAVAVAVVGLRWHYPSDALAGVVLGVGLTLGADGVLHAVAARLPGTAPSER